MSTAHVGMHTPASTQADEDDHQELAGRHVRAVAVAAEMIHQLRKQATAQFMPPLAHQVVCRRGQKKAACGLVAEACAKMATSFCFPTDSLPTALGVWEFPLVEL